MVHTKTFYIVMAVLRRACIADEYSKQHQRAFNSDFRYDTFRFSLEQLHFIYNADACDGRGGFEPFVY